MAGNLERLTQALKRNEELTRDLEYIVHNTTASLLEYAGGGSPIAEPEFHKKLDMGKVRLHVAVPGGASLVVPCDHRQKVAEVIADVTKRSGKSIVELRSNGAAITPTDTVGDILIDGDRVVASTVVAAAAATAAHARDGAAGGEADQGGEVDMGALMAEIGQKLQAADDALRARAEEEKKAKIEAEAVLTVFKSVAKDKNDAVDSICGAVLKMLGAEAATVYFVEAQMGKDKKLRVARAMTAATLEGVDFPDGEELLHKGDVAVLIGSDSFAGMISQDSAEGIVSKLDRTVVVNRPDPTAPVELVVGNTQLLKSPAATWDQSGTIHLGGRDTPAGFSPKSVLAAAVTYTAPSKNMVTKKTDEELREVFHKVDEDGSGALEREELSLLAKELGKRLTERELDEAMKDMDEDGGGSVEVDEFIKWWQDAYAFNQIGNVVGVIEVVNRSDGTNFDASCVDMLQRFMGQVGHLMKEFTDNANYSLAVSGDGLLAMFQDKSQLRTLKTTKEKLSPKKRFQDIGRKVQTARRMSVEFSPAEAMAAMELTKSMIHESSLLTGLNLPDIEELQKWSFPSLEYSPQQMIGCVLMVFRERGLYKACNVSEETIMAFATNVFSRYNDVAFHNVWHAFTVFQGCYWALIKCKELRTALTSTDQFALLISALCHDIGHDGYNNPYHVQMADDLSMLYNDASPLENLHARSCFEAAKVEGCDVFKGLEKKDYKQVRGQIIGCIIQTDMAHHGSKMTKLDATQDFDAAKLADPKEDLEKLFWMEVVLHGLDIANVAYKWPEAVRNARMCVTEFKAQVVAETENGLDVSGFMDIKDDFYTSDRLPNLAKMQVGFGNFVVKPCLEKVARHLPVFEELVETLDSNIQAWKDHMADESLTLPLPTGNEKKCIDTCKHLWHS